MSHRALASSPASSPFQLFRAALLTSALSACGSNSASAGPSADAAARTGTDAATCSPFLDAGEPDAPFFVVPDTGIPFEGRSHALASARCDYWARCSPGLAAYVRADCVAAMETNFGWQFPLGGRGGVLESVSIAYPLPNPALLAAVDAGRVLYDPFAQAACIEALEAQTCTFNQTQEAIPPCQSVFSCPPGGSADGDAGGQVDGGAGCAALVPPTYPTCKSDIDCPPFSDGGPQYCVAGACTLSPCGRYPGDVNCSNFVPMGSACDSSPPLLNSVTSLSAALEDASVPEKMCAYGLTCSGLGGDGGFGVCSPGADVGGACDESAAVSGCLYGLTCSCGVCQRLPKSGRCTSDSECDIGAAYCDTRTNACRPVLQAGQSCPTFNASARGLSCLCVPITIEPPSEDGGSIAYTCSNFVCGPAQDKFAPDAGG